MRRPKMIFRVLAILALAVLLAGCEITSKTASPDPVTVGEQLTFTIDVAFEPGEPGTVVVDELPDSVRFVSATVDVAGGVCLFEPAPELGGNTVVCLVPNPDPVNGGAATITIVVTPTGCGTFTNTAFIPDILVPSLSEEQLAAIEQVGTGQQTAAQLLEQLPVEEFVGTQQSLPVLDEESVSFTVVGCDEPQPAAAQPAAAQPTPITQEVGQESESGETDLSFEVS